MICSTSEIAQKIAYNHTRQLVVVVSHTKATYTSRALFQEAIWIKIQWSCPNFLTFRTSRPRLSRSDHSSSLKGRSTKITRELWTIIVTNKNNSKVGSIEGRRSKTNWWIFLSTSRKEIFKRNLRTFRTRSNSWTRRKRSGLSNWTSSKVVSRTKIWRVWRNRGKNWRENKKIVTKINDTKKKISHLEVQIEELITIKHIGVTEK